MVDRSKARDMITQELRWLHMHGDLHIPQWYINLLASAEYRYMMNDFSGALHDATQAHTGRIERLDEERVIII